MALNQAVLDIRRQERLAPGTPGAAFRTTNPHRRVAFLPFPPVTLKSLIPKPYDFKPKTLGEHILKKRLELGLEQQVVAQLLGVSPSTVLNWEMGHNKPSIRAIGSVIAFLGEDPELPHPQTIAEHLLAKRRRLGWTQREVALHLAVDSSTYSSWERHGTILVHAHRRLVADHLGLPLEAVERPMTLLWHVRHTKESGKVG